MARTSALVPKILGLLTDIPVVGTGDNSPLAMADNNPLATEGSNQVDMVGNSSLVDMASRLEGMVNSPADTEANRVVMARVKRLEDMGALIRREAMVVNLVASPVANQADTAEESQVAMAVARVATATPTTTLSLRTAAVTTRILMVVTKSRATAAVAGMVDPITTSTALATRSVTAGTILLMSPTRGDTDRVVTIMKAGMVRAVKGAKRKGTARVVNRRRVVDTNRRTARVVTRTRMASAGSPEEEEAMGEVKAAMVKEVMGVAMMPRSALAMAITTETTTTKPLVLSV